MSNVEIGFSALGILFVLLAMRIPIGLSLIVVSFGGLWVLIGWKGAYGAIGIVPYKFTANWVLSSIPMFLLMGYVAYHAQLTKGLFQAARVWMGALPGGLAISAVIGSSIFAAVTGSSLACTAAMGRIAVPEMLRSNYHPELATGTVAIAGTIGALIPPSILLILYGVIASQPVPHLFLAGLGVGVISAIAYVVVIVLRVAVNPNIAPPVNNDYTWRDRFTALGDTWPIILVMIFIFAGLFGGIFTATEAGALGAFFACIVGFAKRTLTWQKFRAAALECLLTTSALIVIGVGASLFTRFLAISGVGTAISTTILGISDQAIVILIMIVVLYLLIGCFLEPVGALLLTLPIVLPIILAGGYDMIWFGLLLVKLLEIGMVTPPIGMNVFVMKGVVGDQVSLTSIFKGVGWFIVMDLVVVAGMIAFPETVLWLPNLLLN
ncbi:TRAP transporter large permease [Seohaeicola zhoushanensis]|uniref:TRAP transporter large permease protein n=1 Tax=Seohaeicola zhoushanensis TaxID=1569283 RepID=A0A8J3GZN2_9RHOB|nr:TRAP transporter large permease [Seohaeicola zhoushanensis]GHF62468.1 C4-dicarboxylate ABC transporter [Seohaeicola zhoushanensis]